MNLSTVDLIKKLGYKPENGVCIEGDLLHRVQDVVLNIAEDVVGVCEDEKIVYHLTGGSALGAVRHKGFIPWDDDMDIDMLGEDFDRFMKAFNKKYGDKYWINTCHTPNYGGCGNKVRLKGSIFRGRDDLYNEECGFFFDIFRIENTPNNFALRKLHGFFCMGFGFLLSCRNFYNNRSLMLGLANGNKEAMRAFKVKINIGRLLSFMSVTKWAELTQWVYGLCKNNQSKYVTVPAGRKHYFGEMRLREDFVETTDCEFEGHRWKVPKDYDGYLKSMYGDYMKIPAEEDREKHILLELKFPE